MESANNTVSEWINLFPQYDPEDNTSSLIYIKKLTTIAISTITYLKDILPPKCYTAGSFEGMNLLVLKKDCSDNLAKFLNTSLEAAFDAIDKKYLHQLALCFYREKCKLENIIESHVFEYIYKEGRVTMNVHSRKQDEPGWTFENIREQTAKFLKYYCILMDSAQKDLTLSYGVSLRLYYYEDAPADYHAPGFSVEEDAIDHLDNFSMVPIKVGAVETPSHRLELLWYTKGNDDQESQEAIASQNVPVLSNESEKSDSTNVRPRLLCPCDMYSDCEQSEQLLTCFYCSTQQHAACFGVLGAGDAPSRHCCARCGDADGARSPTDLQLVPLAQHERTGLCIFRRTLWYCSSHERVDERSLSQQLGMAHTKALRLMKTLHRHGIVVQSPGIAPNEPPKINVERLQLVLNKYFNQKEQTVADRLIAEIELSQSSQQLDPIENVLRTVDKNDLSNTSKFFRVIDKPVHTVDEDATLKQYREAFVSEEVKEPVASVGIKEYRKRKSDPNTKDTRSVGKKRTRIWSK